MAQSILNSTKKILGLGENDTSFDVDIMLHINSVISVLTQVGIGPAEGFMIEDATATWDAFVGDDPRLNLVKTYVYLRVRLLFDPPGTSFVIDSMEKQISEFEWRLNVQREEESWVDPTLPAA
uniref:Virion structural protein n=1 Tax=Streptomyces phage Scarif TaxID=3158858 RepID=A0AAU7GYC9_9CAUD